MTPRFQLFSPRAWGALLRHPFATISPQGPSFLSCTLPDLKENPRCDAYLLVFGKFQAYFLSKSSNWKRNLFSSSKLPKMCSPSLGIHFTLGMSPLTFFYVLSVDKFSIYFGRMLHCYSPSPSSVSQSVVGCWVRIICNELPHIFVITVQKTGDAGERINVWFVKLS